MTAIIGWLSDARRAVPFAALSAIALTGTLLAYLRVPGVTARTVWAEDGSVFLREYLDQGPGLLNPYAGYLHLLPRFIVAVVTPVFGIAAYPMAITVACSVVLGLTAALTFYCASELTTSIAARLCWASIPVLVAPGALETMANVANLHWYLLWLTPWILIKSPSGWGEKIFLGGAALVVGLTEIQAVFFLVLVFFRWKDKSLWWAKAGLAAGIAFQLVTFWQFPRTAAGTGEEMNVISVVYGYFLNTSSAVLYGSSNAISNHIQDFGAFPAVLSGVPFAVSLFLLARFGDRRQRVAGGMWVITSCTLWTAAVALNPASYFNYVRFDSPKDWSDFFLSRYSTVPTMFLLALIPLLTVRPGPGKPSGRISAAMQSRCFRGGVVGAFIILQSVYFFPIDAARSTGPEWEPQIRTAELACLADPALERTEIHQAPEGWVTMLRCQDLHPDASP